MTIRREQFLNGITAVTTLNEVLDDSETVITVTDGTVFPATGDYQLIIEDEVVLVTARSGNDLTVERGVDDTTAIAHSDSLTIKAVTSANNFIDLFDQTDALGLIAQGGGNFRVPYRLLNQAGTTLTKTDFTWVSQVSSSVADDPWGGLTATIVETSGDWKLLYKAAPTPPYKVTANIMFGAGIQNGGSGTTMGLGFRDSGSDKFIVSACEIGDLVQGWRFTSPAVFSAATTTNVSPDFEAQEMWLQIEDDNSNLRFRISSDGITWFEHAVDGRTAFIAGGPDQIAWIFRTTNGLANRWAHLRAWVEE